VRAYRGISEEGIRRKSFTDSGHGMGGSRERENVRAHLFEDKEEGTMLAKLRVGFLLVKSLMICVGIIVMSVCGIFIRLRLAR
jgi:hypothetical protein